MPRAPARYPRRNKTYYKVEPCHGRTSGYCSEARVVLKPRASCITHDRTIQKQRQLKLITTNFVFARFSPILPFPVETHGKDVAARGSGHKR